MARPTLWTIGLVSTALAARTAAAAGTFTAAPITGDADSGISTSKTYTHAVDFARASNFEPPDPGTTINGVPFHVGTPSGPNYTTTGFSLALPFDMPSRSVPSGPNTLDDLLQDFYFSGAVGSNGNQTLTLSGLTPGTTYATTFYSMGFDVSRTRVVTVSASDGGTFTFDQNFTGEGNPSVLRYTFTAAEPTLTYLFDPGQDLDTFHQHGFTNEIVPEPACALPLAAMAALVRRPRRNRRTV